MKRKNENDIDGPLKKPKQLSDTSNLVTSLIERLKEEQNVISGIIIKSSLVLWLLIESLKY